ncbi:hypothetical protein ISS05_03325 [Candidatus Woesearchaeota archaeon]|nr:hypothetical protein [Candidatus Woesearchaeota archaeon]
MKILKLFKQKKAEDISARKVMFYIIFGFAAPIVFLLLLYVFSSTDSSLANMPQDLELNINLQRFLNSPYCLAYTDKDTLRTYQGILDFDKFDSEDLGKCYPAEKRNVLGFRLTLKQDNEEKVFETGNWEGASRRVISKRVLVFKDNKIGLGDLFIEIQNAK